VTRTRVVVAGVLALMVLSGVAAIGWGLGRMGSAPTIVVAAGPVVEASPAVTSMPIALSSPSETRDSSPAGGALPVLLTADPGLSDSPTTASGYRITRAGIDPQKFARQLASALGVTGEPRSSNTQIVSGDDPQITVNLDSLLTWNFSDTHASADAPVGKLPTRQQAIDLASTLLGKLGVDLTSIDWQVERVDAGVRVTGWQLVAQQRTTLSWTVTVGRSGSVVSATGFAAGLQEVPGYRVVGAAFAVRRAGLTPWTALPPVPVSLPDVPSPSPSLPVDGRLQVATQHVRVTDAVLGLAQYLQPDASVLILPSYLLTGADGSVWSLLAVTGDAVSFGPDPSPSAS